MKKKKKVEEKKINKKTVKLSTVKPVAKVVTQKWTKTGFQGQLSHNAGEKYCRMLPLQHSVVTGKKG